MFIDNKTQVEIKYEEVIITQGQNSVSISHEAFNAILDQQKYFEYKMLTLQRDYEEWLEKHYRKIQNEKAQRV